MAKLIIYYTTSDWDEVAVVIPEGMNTDSDEFGEWVDEQIAIFSPGWEWEMEDYKVIDEYVPAPECFSG